MSERKFTRGPYLFEPHNGLGGFDPDGSPWPFGYISTSFPQPIFQLDTVLGYPAEELIATAHLMAASHDLFEALTSLKDAAVHLSACMATKSRALHERADGKFYEALTATNAALSKALGQSGGGE